MTSRWQQVLDNELPTTSSWQIPNLGICFENAYPRNFLAQAKPLNSSLGDKLLTEEYPWKVSHNEFLTTWLPNAKLPHDNKFLTMCCQQWVPDEFLTWQWWVPDLPMTSSWQIPGYLFENDYPKKLWREPCLWIHRLAIVWKTNEASTLPESIYHLWRAARCQESQDAMGRDPCWTCMLTV